MAPTTLANRHRFPNRIKGQSGGVSLTTCIDPVKAANGNLGQVAADKVEKLLKAGKMVIRFNRGVGLPIYDPAP
jgi:hypothetical protein